MTRNACCHPTRSPIGGFRRSRRAAFLPSPPKPQIDRSYPATTGRSVIRRGACGHGTHRDGGRRGPVSGSPVASQSIRKPPTSSGAQMRAELPSRLDTLRPSSPGACSYELGTRARSSTTHPGAEGRAIRSPPCPYPHDNAGHAGPSCRLLRLSELMG